MCQSLQEGTRSGAKQSRPLLRKATRGLSMASSKYGHQNSITKHPENREKRRVNRKIKRLRAEMGEISKQHESIRQGQKEMRERFVEIESECDQLKKETQLVTHASDNVQLRLNIIFKILKAREEKDFRKAADLTSSLRNTLLSS